MNSELKRISLITAVIFLISVITINIHTYFDAGKYIPEASRSSQVRNTNLLRKAKLNHPSERKHYPDLAKKKKLRVIAEPTLNRVYILNGHRVIYIMHAKINVRPDKLVSQGKSGQELYQKQGKQFISGVNWTEFDHHYYFEAVVTANNQPVKRQWLAKATAVPDSIQLSIPDARWIQGLPKNTPVIIR